MRRIINWKFNQNGGYRIKKMGLSVILKIYLSTAGNSIRSSKTQYEITNRQRNENVCRSTKSKEK